MNICLYQYRFHTLGIDLVGELPPSISGNKYILIAVCPFSNFLISVPILDKTASTCARVLLDHVFLKFGFPSRDKNMGLLAQFWTTFTSHLICKQQPQCTRTTFPIELHQAVGKASSGAI